MTFTPNLDVLPTAQQALWPELSPTANLGMVLYGGTAIALRLGHRQSVDFDFFTEKNLDKDRLFSALPILAKGVVLQDEPNTLTLSVTLPSNDDPVKLSFFGGLSFGRIDNPERSADGVVVAASIIDLMAHKTKVLLQRVDAKDYQDIAAMIRAGVSLERGLAGAQAMYGRTFQPSESLKAMVYFEGGDLHLLSADDKSTLVTAVALVRDLPPVPVIAQDLGAS
jgi:hypothetical protein